MKISVCRDEKIPINEIDKREFLELIQGAQVTETSGNKQNL